MLVITAKEANIYVLDIFVYWRQIMRCGTLHTIVNQRERVSFVFAFIWHCRHFFTLSVSARTNLENFFARLVFSWLSSNEQNKNWLISLWRVWFLISSNNSMKMESMFHSWFLLSYILMITVNELVSLLKLTIFANLQNIAEDNKSTSLETIHLF